MLHAQKNEVTYFNCAFENVNNNNNNYVVVYEHCCLLFLTDL